MVNMISTVNYINCCMHFNTTNFGTCKILFIVDMMDMIVFNE